MNFPKLNRYKLANEEGFSRWFYKEKRAFPNWIFNKNKNEDF